MLRLRRRKTYATWDGIDVLGFVSDSGEVGGGYIAEDVKVMIDRDHLDANGVSVARMGWEDAEDHFTGKDLDAIHMALILAVQGD